MRPRTDVLVSLSVLLTVVLGMVSPSASLWPMADLCRLSVPGVDRCLLQGRIAWRRDCALVQRTLHPALDHVAAAACRAGRRSSLCTGDLHLQSFSAATPWCRSCFIWPTPSTRPSLRGLSTTQRRMRQVNRCHRWRSRQWPTSPSTRFRLRRYWQLCGTNRCSACWRHFFWAWPYYPAGAVVAVAHVLRRGTPWTIHRPAGAAPGIPSLLHLQKLFRQVGRTPRTCGGHSRPASSHHRRSCHWPSRPRTKTPTTILRVRVYASGIAGQ